jgi:transposase-like protein
MHSLCIVTASSKSREFMMRRIIALKKKPLKGKRDYRPRRIWTLQQKLDLLERASQPGSSASAVAREHDIDIRLIFQWRRDLKEGLLAQRTWGQPRKRSATEVAEVEEPFTADDSLV